MITPVDIQNKEFKTSAIGYNKQEVEEFLSLIESEFEALYKQNIALNDKINMLTEAVKQYKSMETALQNTIVTAQTVSEEMKNTATLKAETIIKEAENKAADMLINAKNQVNEINSKHEVAKQQYEIYKAKIKTVIEEQLKTINTEL